MTNRDVTIIRVRRGIPGKAKYCACDNRGTPIRGFNKLSDVREHWKKEIKWGYVKLVRELDKEPDFTEINETKKMLEEILKSYGKKRNKSNDRTSAAKPSVISNLKSNANVIKQLEKQSGTDERKKTQCNER